MQLNDAARLTRRVARAFAPDTPDRVGVAVSGGGDSMALLHLAHAAMRDGGLQVYAVTVDHGLRPEAPAEAAQVAAICADLGLPHTTLEWRDWDGHGNLQAAARTARYRMIADWANGLGIAGVMLGHTMDDVAETYLMRLSRKAGVDGLAMMDQQFTRAGLRWARPLTHVGRAELRAYLTSLDAAWVEDPSNDDVDFDRVRVRKALVDLDALGLPATALHHASHAAREARDALDYYTGQEAAKHVRMQFGDLLMPARPDLPPEMLRRLKSKAIQWVGKLDVPPRQTSITHMETGLAFDGRATVAGCLISVEGSTLRLTREANAVRMLRCATMQVWDGRWALEGPHDSDLTIGVLGRGIETCPDWRDAGLPRASVMASPAIWRDDQLIAAPIAGLQNGWTARIVADFHSSLVTH